MINILILGGGFGGIRAALDLEKKLGYHKDIKITLIDRASEQTFYPALYELASIFGVDHQHPFHTKLRGTIAIPYSEIFKHEKVALVEAEIDTVNIADKQVTTTGGNVFNFDYLVIAFGSVISTFGIPGVDEYAFKFKNIEDGLILADKIEELYDHGAKGMQNLPIKIIVGGAGFAGVELAAELSNCTVHIAHRHNITQNNCTSITLLEAGPMMLPMVSEKERKLIKNQLIKLGINIMENSQIAEVNNNNVKLKSGEAIEGDMIVWTAGVKAPEIVKKISGLELDEHDRVMVNEFLQTKNHQNVFAIGDATVFIDPKTNKPVPQMATPAIEEGKATAENIYRLILNKNSEMTVLKKYKPEYGSWIAPVGGKYAVAHVNGWTFSGYIGYLVREAVDYRYFLNVLPFFKATKLFLTDVRMFGKND